MDQSGRNDETTRLEHYLKSPVIKRSVMIAGHATSVSLERPFWDALTNIAEREGISLNALITQIDDLREAINLSSALRLYILHNMTIKII